MGAPEFLTCISKVTLVVLYKCKSIPLNSDVLKYYLFRVKKETKDSNVQAILNDFNFYVDAMGPQFHALDHVFQILKMSNLIEEKKCVDGPFINCFRLTDKGEHYVLNRVKPFLEQNRILDHHSSLADEIHKIERTERDTVGELYCSLEIA